MRVFFYFLWINLKKDLKREIDIILLSVILLSTMITIFGVFGNYQEKIRQILDTKPDFILQNTTKTLIPSSWIDEVLEIRGISDVSPRLYLKYKDFYILGVDFFSENANKNISKLLSKIDLKKFFSKNYALVSKDLKLKRDFKLYNEKFEAFFLSDELSKLIPKNSIIIPLEKLQALSKVGEEKISDISLNVPNNDEWDTVKQKLDSLFFNSVTFNKKDLIKAYVEMFNFKGGFFLLLYLIVIAIFSLILNSRYSNIYSEDRKIVGILKGIGWSIGDILYFKLFESLILIFISFFIAFIFAFLELFYLKDFFGEIFFNTKDLNLIEEGFFSIDFGIIFSIFLLYAVAFIASVLIPVWKIAIIEPKEAME
jgi:ABC-type lipoprotein release transport system permease subunit